MSWTQSLLLILLSALWGSASLGMRVIAPVAGPGATCFYRILSAAVFLTMLAPFLKKKLNVREHWRHYLLLGTLNSAIPFFLFAYAAQSLTASLLSILNAFTPMWGAVLGSVFRIQSMTPLSWLGLLLGIIGVAILVGLDTHLDFSTASPAVAAVVLATFFYGLASVYSKKARTVDPFANAQGSLWGGALVALPTLYLVDYDAQWTPSIICAVILLGIFCSGIAYLLFFKLLKELPPSSVLTVSFLIPFFGILWGVLFLDEHIGWNTFVGAIVALFGTSLVTQASWMDRIFQKIGVMKTPHSSSAAPSS